MASQFQVDNNSIGGTPFLTFTVDAAANKDFTQSDLDNNLTACVLSDNNEVGMGSAGDRLFGRVVWLSLELQIDTTVPALCAVQARGVARFKYAPTNPPVKGSGVRVDGEGRVGEVWRGRKDSNSMVGHVMAINTQNQTCDVWLG